MKFPSDRPLTWVFTGDSITQGVVHTYLERSWVELAHERLRWQLDRHTDIVINSGVSGWTSTMVADKFDWLIGRFAPDVLSLSLGTNDAFTGFEHFTPPDGTAQRLTTLIERGRDAGATSIFLHTPVLIAPSDYVNRPGFDDYAPMIRDVAATTGVTLVDHDRHWREHWGQQIPFAWLDDAVHPNARGHREIAKVFFQALGVGEFETY